jgi:putative transposase
VERFIFKQSRTVTLWEGRYRSSPIKTDAYLLACCRYAELNPVRAHMSDDLAAYPWPSDRCHAGIGSQFGWLDIDPCFEGLGNCDDERAMRFREFVQSVIPAAEWELIREALQRGQLTGTKRFCDEIEAIIGRRIENRKQGRPRKDTQK